MLKVLSRLIGKGALVVWMLVASAASAEEPAIDRGSIATEVFYGFCIDLLDGEATIEGDDRLVSLGFPAEAETKEHPDYGLFSAVKIGDNSRGIVVGGADGIICNMIVTGEDRISIRDQLRANLPSLGLEFERDENAESPSELIDLETFRSKIDDELFLDVSFMTVKDTVDNPSIIAAIYFKAN